MCDGAAVDVAGLPSPKFHEYTGEPVVVLVKFTAKGPQPLDGVELKLTCGAGAIVIVMVVSSLQLAVFDVRRTEKFPAVVNT